jgi:hypothetical protein
VCQWELRNRRRKMSTWNYVVTAHKPTNVTHSCVGNFTSPQDLNLIIAFVLFNTTLILGFFLFFLQFLNLFIFFFQEMHSHRDSFAYSSGLTGIHNNFFDFVSAQSSFCCCCCCCWLIFLINLIFLFAVYLRCAVIWKNCYARAFSPSCENHKSIFNY